MTALPLRLALALALAALPAAGAELACPTLYESGSPALVGSAGTAVALLTSSPQDHVPAAGVLRCFEADDGLGFPRLIRVAKSTAGAVSISQDDAPAFVTTSTTSAACPFDAAWCANWWPSATDGSVTTSVVRETRGSCAWRRTFHSYVPARVGAGPVPLVVVLHGGFGNGLAQLENGWDELADGRALAWRPNTATCRFTYPDGYADPASGAACLPPAVLAQGTRPFVVVYPDGLEDDGATPGPDAPRHWEDGRVPSPGQSGAAPVRDDVGFLDHVLAEMQRTGLVDPERMYVAGTSNGGMMTQRVACATVAGAHAELAKLAAVSAIVAALPAPIADGSDGRETCPATGTHELAVQLLVGRGFDTPDCTSYPCASPVVDGDGRMPHGDPGGRYHVYSPELGLVLSGPDSLERWIAFDASATGTAASRTTQPVGFYTQRERVTFGSSPVVVERYLTDGGAHAVAGTRLDLHPWARAWEFLAGYRRLPDGTLVTVPGPPLVGTW